MKVTVYAIDDCKSCADLKTFFRQIGMGFTCVMLPRGSSELRDQTESSGSSTFPQVYFDDRFVGGYDAVRALEQAGKLPEPALVEDPKRFVLFPIVHSDIWDFYKKAQASFWSVEEINLADDHASWKTLTADEKHFIKTVLAFFAASDGLVNENIALNMVSEVQWAEARQFYTFQIFMESIHSEAYSLLLDTYVTDVEEKNMLFNAIETVPGVAKKADWALRWCNSETASFAERLVAFAAVEGIFFSASFCAIYWLKKRGLMPGLCFSNSLIAKDEGLHCDFACLLYSKLINKLPVERVVDIVTSAVEAELQFVTEALPVELLGMSSLTMSQYVRYVADRLLQCLGAPKVYGDSCPYAWMDLISLEAKSNFFEKDVAEYNKSGVGDSVADRTFALDAEF